MEKEVVRVEELTVQSLIKEMVRKEIQEAVRALMDETQKNARPKEYLRPDEAIRYMNDRGLIISLSKLYKLTADKQIPFRRFGERRIVFDLPELDKWIEKQLENKPNPVAKAVAASARRK